MAQRRPLPSPYVPIEHQPGSEVQIDWGEADVILNGQVTRVMLFCARLAYSKATFVRAYRRADQPSFLDGHVQLIDYLNGVPLALHSFFTSIRLNKGLTPPSK